LEVVDKKAGAVDFDIDMDWSSSFGMAYSVEHQVTVVDMVGLPEPEQVLMSESVPLDNRS
jgi:hypothetical protein